MRGRRRSRITSCENAGERDFAVLVTDMGAVNVNVDADLDALVTALDTRLFLDAFAGRRSPSAAAQAGTETKTALVPSRTC